MSFQSDIALLTGSISYFVLHKILHRGGTSFPGKIAYKIDKNLLKSFSKKVQTVIISGTNGKTLTTALIARVLRKTGRLIVTNPSGSNMIQGIFSTFIVNFNKIKKCLKANKKPILVFEVDEANVKEISSSLKPDFFILTNIFRDQMDRYGEIYTTYNKITEGIKKSPKALVIANGDSPILARKNYPNRVVYYGFSSHGKNKDLRPPINTDGILAPNGKQVLHYHFINYSNLGDYFTIDKSFFRPPLKYQINKIDQLTPSRSIFEIEGKKFMLPIGGLYNTYNALAAYAVGREFNISKEQIFLALNEDSRIFGRQEQLKFKNHLITIMLVKNPVGANAVIDMMLTDRNVFSLVMLLNAHYADGIDTSWIFDAQFEKLHKAKLKKLIIGGQRYKDFSVRMKMAGFKDQIIIRGFEGLIDKIKQLPTKNVYVIATYTSMLMFREALAKQNLVKESF